ncbi:F-box protein At3g58530 [Impatiens glandulifera]|uniref:F-box protein At3g58530 n=1 Tax=Impatiens glandulifera TaxID=253017 RepID=UPI001FB0CACB|nr:F-box protein At3g58530 [Impatiens glandulifera]
MTELHEMEEERDETQVEEDKQYAWNRETVPRVLKIVSTRLSQRDLISLLLVSPSIHRTLISYSSLWLVLDFHEMTNAGDRLVSALSLQRYRNVKQIILEFGQDIEDTHLDILRSKYSDFLGSLELINLNGCQKISDKGIQAITAACPNLKLFSIYWNLRVTDQSIKLLVKSCKRIVDLNLSGCKNITDKGMKIIADNYSNLEHLNLTRCIKLTDDGLRYILLKCRSLRSLNLYALSSFTDDSYKVLSSLTQLGFLDLCGAQNLTDEGLLCIAKCRNVVSLNLTWCVRITDEGVIAIGEGCPNLEFLSLFGIVGVTDKCLVALSLSCSNTLTTLDVNGCVGIKKRSREDLLQLFPHLICFKVHS